MPSRCLLCIRICCAQNSHILSLLRALLPAPCSSPEEAHSLLQIVRISCCWNIRHEIGDFESDELTSMEGQNVGDGEAKGRKRNDKCGELSTDRLPYKNSQEYYKTFSS